MTDVESAIRGGASEFVGLLNATLMEECVQRVNDRFSLRFMSKLATERLPTHQRNLTDARTRIGILLEYSFALALQDALETNGTSGYRMSYVVTNRYPDLYIRDASSEVVIRLEVKALQLISEEKSANFDALVRDVHSGKDILCVLLWEWSDVEFQDTSINFPEVARGFAFEAYPIARARDLGWLSQRTARLVKGVDVSGPVVGNATSLRKEEHNMGKLMRILGDDELRALPQELQQHPTVGAYRQFKNFTISAGLAHNASRLFEELGTTIEYPSEFTHSSSAIQTIAQGQIDGADRNLVVAAGGRLTAPRMSEYARELRSASVGNALVVIFNEKFFWSIHEFDGTKLMKTDDGKKFEGALAAVESSLGV